jgi:predicted amidohydrolase
MGDFVVSAVQQQVKIYETPLAYQADMFRLLEMAQAKGAQLVVLPALSPLVLIPPLAARAKLGQLKKDQEGKSGLSGFFGKLLGKGPGSPKGASGVKEALIKLLDEYPGEIYDAYIDLFSAAALKHQMTIVAGSFYLREGEDAPPIHVSYVFGPDGMVLGRQEKIHPTNEEESFCQAGEFLQAIDTPVGRLGILIQEDVLYPECGRILAYNGVEILINLTATIGQPGHSQIRHAFLARVDENGLLGAQSCLVGKNLFDLDGQKLVGRAALSQPFQLSPHGNGILAEVEEVNLEGLIARPMSIEGLKDYWAQARPQLRQRMHMAAYQPLVKAYRQQRTLDQVYWNPDAPDAGHGDNRGDEEGSDLSSTQSSSIHSIDTPTQSEANVLISPVTRDDD